MDDLERMTNEELEEENQDNELQEGEDNDTSENKNSFISKIVTGLTIVSLFIVLLGFDKQIIAGLNGDTIQQKFVQFYLEYLTPVDAMKSDVWAINLAIIAVLLQLLFIIFSKQGRTKIAVFRSINLIFWIVAASFIMTHRDNFYALKIKNEGIDVISNIKIDGILKVDILTSKQSKWVLYKSNYPNTVDKIADTSHKITYTTINKEEKIPVRSMEKMKRVGIQPIDFKL